MSKQPDSGPQCHMFALNRHKYNRPGRLLRLLLTAALLVPAVHQCAVNFGDENFWTVPYAYNEFINGAPGISVTSPADGDTNVSTNQTFVVAFSKVVNSTTATLQSADGACTGTIQLSSDEFATCMGGTLFTSDNQLFGFVSSTVLTGGLNYKLRVTEGVTDLAGNSMLAAYTMASGFTTTTNLTVVAQNPVAGTTSVPTNTTNFALGFGKVMNASNLFMQTANGACVTASNIRVSNDNFATCLGGTLTTGTNPVITITLPANLSESSTYQIRVMQTAFDITGSGLQAVYTGAFTTFGPGDVGGGTLQVWLKADGLSYTDLGVTAAGNGDFIQQWNDASGNNNNATQTTALRNPVLVVNQPAINNKPVMRFDGTAAPNDDHMDLTTFTTNVTASGFTAIGVVKLDSVAAENVFISQLDGGGTGRNYFRFHNNCGGNPRISTFYGFGNTCGPSDSVVGTWYVGSVTFGAGNVTVYVNGAAGAPVGRGGENATGLWRIGSSKANTFPLDGDIAELLVYTSGLSVANRQTVECYLSYKYGITITGHTCP